MWGGGRRTQVSLGEPSHGPKHDGYLASYYVYYRVTQETLSLLDNVNYFLMNAYTKFSADKYCGRCKITSFRLFEP